MDLKTDSELLELHRQGSKEAFAELVRRHINWIYSIAKRRVRDEHLAEDITQATFAVLARKSPKLHSKHPLSAWLFHVVTLASKAAQRTESRRRHHETEATKMRNAGTASEQEQWTHLEPDLDRAVSKLRRADRAAILLRFYEQKSYAEVAAALGITETAARRRVSRAVEKLGNSLSLPKPTLHSTMLASLISIHLVTAAPAGLTGSVISSSAVSSKLAIGALKAMALSKAKSALLLVAIVILAGGGATTGVIWMSSRSADAVRQSAMMAQSAAPVPMIATSTSAPADPTLPTPQALMAAMLETRSRYKTMSVEFHTSRYRAVNGIWPTQPDETVSQQIKRTPGRIYSHAIETSRTGQTESYYSITPTVTKRLAVNENFGLVSKTSQFMAPDMDITGALWEAVESSQKATDAVSSSVNRSAEGNLLVLTTVWSNRRTQWTIDPAMGNLPVKTMYQHPDGRPAIWYECSDFRKSPDGLWIPYRYTAANNATDSKGASTTQFRSDFVVDQAQLNILFSDAELDFRFPPGTRIQDQVTPGFLKWLQ